jgi:hypothetical protein
MVDWISLSQTAGTGNATITITASTLQELQDRSTSLIVSGGSQSAYLTVNQLFENKFRVVPMTITNVPWSGGSYSLSVSSSTAWHVDTALTDSWITVESSGSNYCNIAVGINSDDSRRGRLTIRNANNLLRTVDILQASRENISINPSSMVLPSQSGVAYFHVFAYVPWTIESSGSWYTFNTMSGESGDTTLIMEYEKNDDDALRYDTFYLTDGDYRAKATLTQESKYIDRSTEYFTVVAEDDGEVTFYIYNDFGVENATAGDVVTTVDYRINYGVWNTLEFKYLSAATVSVNMGDQVAFRGTNNCYGGDDSDVVSGFGHSTYLRLVKSDTTQGAFTVFGNIMSLFWGDAFIGKKAFPTEDSHLLESFFYDSRLRDSRSLSLPASTVPDSAYRKMFFGCDEMTAGPELPATAFSGGYNYYSMFSNCSSLVLPPSVLPATAVTSNAYRLMFSYTPITVTPRIMAESIGMMGTMQMFSWCTELVSISYFSPSSVGANGCYAMFNSCHKLEYIPSDILSKPNLTMGNIAFDSMFAYCYSLKTAPELPSTNLSNTCYAQMFMECTGLTVAPSILPAKTLTSRCYEMMFRGCISLPAAPIIFAETMNTQSCQEMFSGCTSLNYVKCLATNISANMCTEKWMDGVAERGLFVKNPNMNAWPRNVNGIPSGWSVTNA